MSERLKSSEGFDRDGGSRCHKTSTELIGRSRRESPKVSGAASSLGSLGTLSVSRGLMWRERLSIAPDVSSLSNSLRSSYISTRDAEEVEIIPLKQNVLPHGRSCHVTSRVLAREPDPLTRAWAVPGGWFLAGPRSKHGAAL